MNFRYLILPNTRTERAIKEFFNVEDIDVLYNSLTIEDKSNFDNEYCSYLSEDECKRIINLVNSLELFFLDKEFNCKKILEEHAEFFLAYKTESEKIRKSRVTKRRMVWIV